MSLPSSLLRIASELPQGDPTRRKLLKVLAGYGYPDPRQDFEGFVDAFEDDLMLPYPAIYNALGVERNDVRFRTKIRNDEEATVRVLAPMGTDIVIAIDLDGTFKVSGKIKGEPLKAKTFRFRPGYPGISRGTRSDIVNYIEDSYPALQVEYMVSTQSGTKTYDSVEALTRDWKQTGTHRSPSTKGGLQGHPTLKGLVGPMWDGHAGGKARIRYMDGPTYNMMTI